MKMKAAGAYWTITTIDDLSLPGLDLDQGPGRQDQCAISVGTVMVESTPRVAPPNTNSRQREWP